MSGPASVMDLRFPHCWQAEVLAARPLILPSRHYTYPRDAEEVERGALELLIYPCGEEDGQAVATRPNPFLATCALGFRDAAMPNGVWSAPTPDEICAVSGGYAYLIRTSAPEQFTMIPYRPVLQILPVLEERLLLFVSHRNILAWGANGQAWESAKLSDEGITVGTIESGTLHGRGWQMMTDKESAFALDLKNGALKTVR